jgi:hypothetical protein
VINIYECNDGATTFHESYKSVIGEGWGEEFICTLKNQKELDLYLDIVRKIGYDFVLHTLDEDF